MKLIPEWKEVLAGAWSAWGAYIIIALNLVVLGTEMLVPEFGGAPGTQAFLNMIGGLAVVILRVIEQPVLREKVLTFLQDQAGAMRRKATISAVVIASATATVGVWEGLRTEAYRDVVGVWTVCYGETLGVKPGDKYTASECEKMLEPRVVEFWQGVQKCVPDFAEAPNSVQVAVTSWSYNVGTGAACRSTLARKLNAKDYVGACNELPRWNRAGGRVIRGLTNRRVYERKLCFEDL